MAGGELNSVWGDEREIPGKLDGGSGQWFACDSGTRWLCTHARTDLEQGPQGNARSHRILRLLHSVHAAKGRRHRRVGFSMPIG